MASFIIIMIRSFVFACLLDDEGWRMKDDEGWRKQEGRRKKEDKNGTVCRSCTTAKLDWNMFVTDIRKLNMHICSIFIFLMPKCCTPNAVYAVMPMHRPWKFEVLYLYLYLLPTYCMLPKTDWFQGRGGDILQYIYDHANNGDIRNHEIEYDIERRTTVSSSATATAASASCTSVGTSTTSTTIE